jgi:class 3 adenylate cyclase
VDCALEFQLATRGFETPDHQRIVVRIGIHTGFVIAGVVGKKM